MASALSAEWGRGWRGAQARSARFAVLLATRGGARQFGWWVLALAIVWAQAATAATPVPVTVSAWAAVRQVPQAAQIGIVIAPDQSRVAAERAGRVIAVPVEFGSAVQAGDVLVEVDCSDIPSRQKILEADRSRLRAQREFATSQVQRARSLKQHASEELIGQRETEQAVLQSQLAAIEGNLALLDREQRQCRVTAPFSGRVLERHVFVGEWLNPGAPVVTLVDPSRLEVEVAVAERAVTELAAVTPRLMQEQQSLIGQLVVVAPVASAATGLVAVRLRFDGLTARAGDRVEVAWDPGYSAVSPDWVVERDGQFGVFIVDDGHALFVQVDDYVAGQPAPLSLPDEAQLIQSGRFLVRNGDPVQVIEPP